MVLHKFRFEIELLYEEDNGSFVYRQIQLRNSRVSSSRGLCMTQANCVGQENAFISLCLFWLLKNYYCELHLLCFSIPQKIANAVSLSAYRSYSFHILILVSFQMDKSLFITQVAFTSWPDNGVPKVGWFHFYICCCCCSGGY